MIIINSTIHQLTNGIYHFSLELKDRKIEDDFPIVCDNIDTLITYELWCKIGNYCL
jgi:hypothetical protein